MAEQHEITFAAGLASQGMIPVAAIYSTFLQRAYDQIIHDVELLKVKVLFAIDRAGLVPADGETHQGVYDPAFLSQIGIPTYSPSNYAELRYWLIKLLGQDFTGPQAIRGSPSGGLPFPPSGSERRIHHSCSADEVRGSRPGLPDAGPGGKISI